MSEIYGSLASQMASFVSSTVIENYCVAASAALVLYDHICTIPQEVQVIWGSKLTSTMVLFHANRWLILAYTILAIAGEFIHPRTIFSGIRVYALSGGSRFLPLVVTLLSLVPVGTNAIAALPVFGVRCLVLEDKSETTNTRLISTRVPVIMADTVTLVVTCWKTWATVRMAHEHNVKTPLMTLLLRDGLLSINLLNVVGQTTNIFAYAGAFSTPLSSIIITHFLLNLRQLAHGSPDDTSRPSFTRDGAPDAVHSQSSSLRFGSFVGNMGESLIDGSEDDDRDVNWDDDVQHNVDDACLDAQIIYDSPDASAVPVRDALPEDVMEGERQVDQVADLEPLV
ncbi:hypothetical protein CERSUDRAFT_69189 [Gelatoporia subvermispora B]|uniref:DUF6533 domain-containing protein n=1 Tax=Ceriporiopsis subvermispora (strain B) TaxID=914234 RepID=M2Q4G3_CERS8|nr:hypothetical protein CERSUDRAFT_69189 [Gelatoporia subvermispora B]